ncbi:AAA family ATPase [Candidatus Woesearchaeota archaeon]|nr:AAA family ATPase [Candidatus Woesearchaeota archaeon]
MEREKTGIKKADSMMQGGLPKGSIISLTGPPGVGKSIFVLHFLLEGARKGQKCVYINLEEPRRNIDNMISQFNFSREFLRFVEEGKIVIKCYTYPEYEKLYSELFQKIKEDDNIQRLVIDSFNCFFSSMTNQESLNLPVEISSRRMINYAFSMLRKKELTTIAILEMHDSKHRFYYNIPYLVDGIIKLDFLELGTIERRIFIPKMRWTDQYRESRPYEISKKGIIIKEE